MTSCYHATARGHAPGAIIVAAVGPGSYTARVVQSGNAWVDALLDGRPTATGMPLRSKSMYCCPAIECCAKYAESEIHLARSYRIYEVTPRGRVHAAPMVLVNRIQRRGSPDSTSEAIADEYWRPRPDWRYLEVLADSLEVVQEVEKPDQMRVLSGGTRYDDDLRRVLELGW